MLSCWLPNCHGIVSLVVKHPFNKKFNYIDSDPANLIFLPEQQVFLTLSLQF